MAKLQISTKRIQIDKAYATVLIAVAVTSAVFVFCIIASNALWGQGKYQGHVIDERKKASKQLRTNADNLKQLEESYKAFVINGFSNIIGGSATGNGLKDGDNARLILDALPSVYDFPALITSLEKEIKLQPTGYTISTLSGTDDQATQELQQSSPAPQAIEIPFRLSVLSDYQKSKDLVKFFEQSIRPFSLTSFEIAASDGTKVSTSFDAKTYYQPGKNLEIKTRTIK